MRMTSADIIRRARDAQRQREGESVKVRLPDGLADRARSCAKEVGEQLGDWVNLACRSHTVSDSVADANKSELATRAGSECITVRAPKGWTAEQIRAAVSAAVVYCEQRRVPCTPQAVKRYRVTRWQR